MKLPEKIDFTADLTVSSGSSTANVSTSANDLTVQFASLRDGLGFWRRSDRRSRSMLLTVLERVAAGTEKDLSIRIENQTVALLQPGTRSGLLTKWLGLGPLKVHWATLLRTLLR